MKDDGIETDGGWTLEIRPRNSLSAVDFAEMAQVSIIMHKECYCYATGY